jgi:8-oxo-dGTP diphosphatase
MAQKPFVLSVKAMVRNEVGECLAIRRSAQSKHNAGLWDLPGGKCDPGESMEDALVREIVEETGLQVELTRVVGAAQSDMVDRIVAYLILEAQVTGGALALSGEHDACQWVVRDRLGDLAFVPQFRAVLAAYARTGNPVPATEQF